MSTTVLIYKEACFIIAYSPVAIFSNFTAHFHFLSKMLTICNFIAYKTIYHLKLGSLQSPRKLCTLRVQ